MSRCRRALAPRLHLSVCPSIYLSIYLSIYMISCYQGAGARSPRVCTYLFLSLSIYLYICTFGVLLRLARTSMHVLSTRTPCSAAGDAAQLHGQRRGAGGPAAGAGGGQGAPRTAGRQEPAGGLDGGHAQDAEGPRGQDPEAPRRVRGRHPRRREPDQRAGGGQGDLRRHLGQGPRGREDREGNRRDAGAVQCHTRTLAHILCVPIQIYIHMYIYI